MIKVAILYDSFVPVVDALKAKLTDCCTVDCFNSLNFEQSNYKLIISLKKECCGFNVLKSHHSLLPAFDCIDPEKEAFLAGVKVTGITVFFTSPHKIIAQYPIFIQNDMHYDDLEKELEYIEQILLPEIAIKVIKNEAIDIQKIMNNKSCGGCKGCQK